MIKRTITLELSIDEEKVSKLYPNYNFSFCNVKEFINFIQNSLISEIPKDCMKKFGYSIRNITSQT